MPKDSGIFRSEVFQSADKHEHGDVVLAYPISNYFILAGALTLLVVIIIFTSVGQFTRHVSVGGVLEPTVGVLKLHATQNGILKGLHVREGQTVHKGDVLLDFEMEHVGADGRVAETDIDRTLARQLSALHSERRGTAQLNQIDIAKYKLNLAALEDNQTALQAELDTQTRRVHADEETLTRYERLLSAGFISEIQVQQKRSELLDQVLRLQSMQTNIANAKAEISRLKIELASSPVRGQVATDQIDRVISNVEADLTKQQIGHVWKVIVSVQPPHLFRGFRTA